MREQLELFDQHNYDEPVCDHCGKPGTPSYPVISLSTGLCVHAACFAKLTGPTVNRVFQGNRGKHPR